ncbi:MAG: hypothetical protein ABI870_13135 [Rhodanobacter sp.]
MLLRLPLCSLLFLISLLAAPNASASADQPGTAYTGSLGNQSIVMEIDPPDQHGVTARYFYTRHHRDLQLNGKLISAGHLQLLEGNDDDENRPQVDLVKQPDGGWTGSWQNAQGHTLKLVLRPVSTAPPPADVPAYLQRIARSNPYEYLRLHGLTLQQGRRQDFMGHALQWWIEPDSKVTFFRIMDGYPAPQRERINDLLTDRLWSEVSSHYACIATANQDGGDYDQTVTPRLMTPALISISVFTSYDCGGAHPDFGDGPINLDARTARVLSLEDLVWVGKGKPFHYADHSDEDGTPRANAETNTVSSDVYSSYRTNVFAPWLETELAAQYPKQMTPGHGDDDECGYDDPGVWQFPGWYLTPKGIFFEPSFARAARVCESNADWPLLPYARVVKHPGRLSLTLP